ncbi:MAG: GNAT family N-acetyltransferase [Rhodothermales bacterium]|nr:GNAT family N-acetyltransferase [Rhodothermales bacterium]
MANRKPIVLRAARPTFEEGLVFARYLDEAAEGFIRLMLGSRSEEIVARAFVCPQNDYSFENVTFAEVDQEIVGMASGFTGRAMQDFSDEPLNRAAGFPALRMRATRIAFAPILRILKSVPDEDFYLLSLAVQQKFRGQGIASALMDSLEERAVEEGSERMSLHVSAKNEGAIRLYRRRGMSVVSSWPTLSFVSPVFVHMSRSVCLETQDRFG